MSEIKKQFTGGKMNKDVDERLVPTGEYRDAMNVQVSTSEGSDVGTIQNILGNMHGCDADNNSAIGDDAFTVGSISDEKNDTLYWLISGNSYNPESVFDNNNTWTSGVTMKDYIWQYSSVDGCLPVFVDKYGFSYENPNPPHTFNSNILSGIPISAYEEMQVGWTVVGVTDNGTVSNSATITSIAQPQNYYVDYGFTTQTTPSVTTTYIGANPTAVGSGILIPMNDFSFQPPGGGLPPNWTQSTGNIVYITDFSGSVSGLVGDQITILPYDTTNIQTFTINAASTVGIVFNGGYGSNVVQLTLSANLALFSLPLPNSPGALLQNGTGVASFYNGSAIDALLTSSGTSTNNIATGELMVWYYDVNNFTVGDQIYFSGGQQQASGYYCVTNINTTNNSIYLEDCNNPGTVIDGWQVGGSIYGVPQPFGGSIIIPADNDVTLDQNLDLTNNSYTAIYLTGPRVLNFNHNELITGINIIDDMLFWTDGKTEPKRINIPRSILGTHSSANFHTRLINPDQGVSYSDNIMAKEEHITVVRRAPKNKLSMSLFTGRDPALNYSGIFQVSSASNLQDSSLWDQRDPNNLYPNLPYDFSSFSENTGSNIVKLIIDSDLSGNTSFNLNWEIGSKVVIKAFENNGATVPTVPITGYVIKGTIVPWLWTNANGLTVDVNSFTSAVPWGCKVMIKIESIDGTPPAGAPIMQYAIDLFDETEKLFEFKFPRFSYRYKYNDGEYSTFAPWTSVAFLPGSFDYHPKKGYNLGMGNSLSRLTLRDFITPDMPKDVMEIDILYKDDQSPNVYTVETIRKFLETQNNVANYWGLNEFTIEEENIRAVLPSNQLLRPWDNVPRTAVAQEITGNRIVYANYLQNYTLKEESLNPLFSHYLSDINDRSRSIKSLREYQLGVVFTDKYGRETPVITNTTGVFKIEKAKSTQKNKLTASISSQSIPIGMKYFKFYIKETSGQYYNMVMSRWYDAEDNNIWLAFPSSDRNKVDIDTFLILKKGVAQSVSGVNESARYKILAIENEAPDFIKTKEYNIAEIVHDMTTTPAIGGDVYGSGTTNAPTVNSTYFHVNFEQFENTSAAELEKITDDLYVDFTLADDDRVSAKYKIVEIVKNEALAPASTVTPLNYIIKIDGKFGDDVNFITDDPGNGVNATKILDTTTTRFYKRVVENKAEFDGRFFVKIYFDDVIQKYIKSPLAGQENVEYSKVLSQKIYCMSSSHVDKHSGTSFGTDAIVYAGNEPDQGAPDTITDVALTYGSAGAANWLYYAAFFANYRPSDLNTASYNIRGERLPMGTIDILSPINDTWNCGLDANGEVYNFSPAGSGCATYEDVWFVDYGPFTGTWTNEMNGANLGDQTISTTNGYSNGIINNTGIGTMSLTIGSIAKEPGSGWSDSPFWELNRGLYSYTNTFVQTLSSGYKFRWKEDPTRTVYTITGATTTKKLIRYDDEFDDFTNLLSGAAVRMENFNKRHEFSFTPAMVWDPTESDTVGVISNGMIINGDIASVPLTAAGLVTNGSYLDISTAQYSATYDSQSGRLETLHPGLVLFKIGGFETFNIDDKPVLIHSITDITGGKRLHFIGYKGVKVEFSALTSDQLEFRQPTMNGLSVNSARNINHYNTNLGTLGAASGDIGIGAVGYTLEIVEEEVSQELIPDDPAIWETEPKDSTDLNIYHEISDVIPLDLNGFNGYVLAPVGSIVNIEQTPGSVPMIQPNTQVSSWVNNIVQITNYANDVDFAQYSSVVFTRPDGTSVSIELLGLAEPIVVDSSGNDTSLFLEINPDIRNNAIEVGFDWHNCYSFGNGVESNRIRDNFNQPFISNGVKVSATLDEPYKEEHRKTGLIYSGLYNSTSGINNLNQFIQAEKITKDVNPTYGSIQKLYAGWGQGGDLIALCEDRVLKILANKDALYNADGNSNITSTNNVLGTATPFAGNYGISKNPESFASESFRAYFTDKVRGAVIRLSMDGLTAISDHGMKDWFRDNLKLNSVLVGSYDDKKDEYNITLQQITEQTPKTVSFREDVRGWVSFKSFVPENAISCSNEYYTFLDGKLWKHHDENVNRNTFYNIPADTSFTVILNDVPGSVKSFNTINYEGSQSRVIRNLMDNEYYNLTLAPSGSGFSKDGWYVDSIFTDMESGVVDEFIEKEGKWFNYIKGENILHTLNNNIIINPDGNSTFDQASFAIQGLGVTTGVITGVIIYGCTDATAFNYNAGANTDDGSCIAVVNGCTNSSATNYNSSANTDDGTCTYPISDCTDPAAINYNPAATLDDGSCIYPITGCTDPTASNYDPGVATSDNSCVWLGCTQSSCDATNSTTFPANAYNILDDGSCITAVYGCTNPGSLNYNATANVNQVSCTDTTNPCVTVVNGCMISNADNYNALANTDDGTCTWAGCTNPLATNYDLLAPVNSTVAQSYVPISSVYGIQDEDSIYCTGGGCMDPTADNFDPNATYSVANSCLYCDWSAAGGYNGIPITTSVLNTTGGLSNGQIAIATNFSAPYQPFTYYVYSGNTANNANLIATITSVNNQTLNGISATGSHLVSNLPAGDYVVGISGNPANAANACEYTSPVTTIGSSAVNILGCMDLTACNYDAAANVDQGCEWTSCAGCMDASANGNPAGVGAWGLQVNSLTPCYIGGTFTQSACTIACGDGNSNTSFGNYCCQYTVYGCTDSTANNFYGAVPAGTTLVDDGSCTYCVYGCMNSSATNYEPLATCDDGSCTFPAVVSGCMDPLACNYDSAANTGTQTVYCVYPIPNATITIGGTDPNYGQTGPAYFNTGSPVSNVSKTVKHIVVNDWPLNSLQQQDIGLSFVWDGPAGQMGSYFAGSGERIVIHLLRQTNPDLYPPTSPSALWTTEQTKVYNNPNFSPFNDELGVRNYGGTTVNFPYPWGSAQNASNNYEFPVYFNSTVKHNYKVMIVQKHTLGGVVQYFGGPSNTASVNCGGNHIFEIQDLPCNAADPNLTVYGCTDVSACNYDMYATCDDGSCNNPTTQTWVNDPITGCFECSQCSASSGGTSGLPPCGNYNSDGSPVVILFSSCIS